MFVTVVFIDKCTHKSHCGQSRPLIHVIGTTWVLEMKKKHEERKGCKVTVCA